MTDYERDYTVRLERRLASAMRKAETAHTWAVAMAIVAATGWGGVAIIAASLWWPR